MFFLDFKFNFFTYMVEITKWQPPSFYSGSRACYPPPTFSLYGWISC